MPAGLSLRELPKCVTEEGIYTENCFTCLLAE